MIYQQEVFVRAHNSKNPIIELITRELYEELERYKKQCRKSDSNSSVFSDPAYDMDQMIIHIVAKCDKQYRQKKTQKTFVSFLEAKLSEYPAIIAYIKAIYCFDN